MKRISVQCPTFLFASVFLFAACDTSTPASGVDEEISPKIELTAEEIGQLHTEYLIAFKEAAEKQPAAGKRSSDQLLQLSDAACAQIAANNPKLPIVVSSCNDGTRTYMNGQWRTDAASKDGAEYLEAVQEALSSARFTEEDNLDSFVAELDGLVSQAALDLDPEEFFAVEVAVSVAKSSAFYWSEELTNWVTLVAADSGIDWSPPTASKHQLVDVCSIASIFGFSCAEAAGADLTGAIGAAVTIGVVCLSSGPACPAGVGAWVLGAGAGASAMNTLDQIWSIFNGEA